MARVWDLPVYLLLDSVLFELFIQIASRRIQRFGGLRNVPVVLAELLDEERAFGGLLELSQCAGCWCRAARRRGSRSTAPEPPLLKPSGAPLSRREFRPEGSSTRMRSPGAMIITRSTVLRSSRILPRQRYR
jgi:hypothetical protein